MTTLDTMGSGAEDLFFETVVHHYIDDNRRFQRREWLAADLDECLNERGRRFVLLTAEPGAGKSAFMAQLADAHPEWLRYFIRRDQNRVYADVSSNSLLLRLGYQLAALQPDLFTPEQVRIAVQQRIGTVSGGGEVVGVEVERVLASPFYQNVLNIEQNVRSNQGKVVGLRVDELVVDPSLLDSDDLLRLALTNPARTLGQTDPDRTIVILIDAIDEIRYHSTTANILAWLTNAPELPENVRFVLSSRPPDEALELFRSKQGPYLTDLAIDEDDPRVLTDVRRFVERLAAEPDVSDALAQHGDEAAFIDNAARHAHGNLGYVDALARGFDHAFARGDRAMVPALLSLTDLPTDLKQLYAFFLHQIKVAFSRERVEFEDPETGETYDKGVWSAVHARILGVLAVALEPLDLALITRLATPGVEEADVANGLDQLREFLDLANGRYRLYHASLAEFLTDPATGADGDSADLYQDAPRWHQRIAKHYLGQQGSWRECDDYGLHNLANHVRLSGSPEQLPLLVDNEWMNARVSGGGYLYDGFLDDLNMAWDETDAEARRRIDSGDALGLSASLRCALVNGSIIAQSANYPPALIKYLTQGRVWDVGRALSIAERVPDLPDRVAVLVALLESEQLSTDQYDKARRQALAIAVGLYSELDRGRALQALGPYLDGDLVEQAWTAAMQMRSKWQEIKAPALVALAPRFSTAKRPEALRVALTAALSTWGDNKIDTALPGLIPSLETDLLDEALDEVIKLSYQPDRAEALVTLAPRLSTEQRSRALAAARQMKDPEAQSLALSGLATWLRGPEKQSAWRACLNAVAKARNRARLAALRALAPALEDAYAAEALRLACELDDEDDRADAIAALSPKLDEASLAAALETAYGLQDLESRSKLLCALAPRLSGDTYATALDAALDLDDPDRWAWALADLASTLPDDLSQQAFDSALDLDYGPKFRLLKALAPRMSGDFGERAIAELHRYIGSDDTAEVLSEWLPFLDDRAVSSGLRLGLAIDDVEHRRQVLLALAPRLSPAELEQALVAMREIDDAGDRIAFLLALRPYVSASTDADIRSFSVRCARASELPLRAMSMVAEVLEGGELDDAFRLAEDAGDEYGRMMFAQAFAGRADASTQERALRLALTITNEGFRADALQAFAPKIDPPLLDEVIEAAEQIAPSAARALMIELAPHLSADERRALIRDALGFVQLQLNHYSYDRSTASRLLIAVAPYVEADDVAAVIDLDWSNDSFQAEGLAALAPRLSAAQRQEVLGIAHGMRAESAKLTLLSGLAPHLTPDQLEQLVTTAEDFGPRLKAACFAAAAPLLPLEQGHTILQQALAATADIYSDDERFQSLETLSGVLPEELISNYIVVASAITSAKYRARALAAIGPRAPDPDALQRLARHAIADHIAEDLRGQARPQLMRFGVDLTLLTPPLVEPTTLDAMARAALEVGSDWSWL